MAQTLNGSLPGLKVGRSDPKAETEAYIARMMAARGKNLDDAGGARRTFVLPWLPEPPVGVAALGALAHSEAAETL